MKTTEKSFDAVKFMRQQRDNLEQEVSKDDQRRNSWNTSENAGHKQQLSLAHNCLKKIIFQKICDASFRV
jgi:hypothetical protein